MQVFLNFITDLGENVLVPIMIFLVALGLRVRVTTAVRSAILVGVALAGFAWIITDFTPIVTKVIHQVVTTTGLHRSIVDTGWQSAAIVAFDSPVGISFFMVGLILEILLFLVGYTKVFFATNLWQNWGFMIWGTIAYVATHNFWLSFSLTVFMMLITLWLAEVQADRYADYFKIPNSTVAALHNIENVVPAILLDPLWNLIGLNRVHLTPANLKKKLGLLGEPMIIGAILGLVLGLLAHLNQLGSVKAWGQVFLFAVQLGAVMTIFPMIASLFGQAFTPITGEITDRQKQGAGRTIFTKKRWFVALDDGIGYGEPASLMLGMLLIPIMLVLAVILPGNRMLPVVDLIALPFMMESVMAVYRGNLVKGLATAVIWLSLGLYAGSYMAPFYTATLAHYGVIAATGASLVVSFNIMARPLNTLIFMVWMTGNLYLIGILVVLYLVAQFMLRRHQGAIWHYLETMAAKNWSEKG
ncbi:PTS galactitol transporter subunit IIC [Lactobacillaceae bacterium L1_55_11]|nr:PTS galactitol transporter subunit IIC [Lactobacillaceae bacterium L1_55_11]